MSQAIWVFLARRAMCFFVSSAFIVCTEPRKFMLIVWRGYGY